MFIKGVNLGNWLVLEKWMSPALFEGTDAEDEYYLPRQLDPAVYEARIKIHRSEYITERDFATIKKMDLDAVRIPVPYFVFGDRSPFLGCIDELDHAFAWAEKYQIRILIDLHTVPLSQNGFDNGGICGVCKWSQHPEEVDFVLDVLEKLAVRYGHRKGLFGITPINEPITEELWNRMDIQKRYRPYDPELAKGSAPNSKEFLESFYTRAYEKIRPHLDEEKYVVFHDAFLLKEWKTFFSKGNFHNVALDTHQYLMFAEARGCEQTLNGYLSYIREHYEKDIAEVQAYIPVIVGEWSIFNSAAVGRDTGGGQTVLNGMDFDGADAMPEEEKRQLYREITKAQITAWHKGSGYFFWSYKLLLDTVSSKDWVGWDAWDLGKSVDLGWFPCEEPGVS